MLEKVEGIDDLTRDPGRRFLEGTRALYGKQELERIGGERANKGES